jgi:hypothetical protein
VSAVPAAPPRPSHGRRYPMSTVTLARQMYGDGDSWTIWQIRNYLRDHHGCEGLSENTVRHWVRPDEAEHYRRQNLARYHARMAQKRATVPAPSPIADVEPILDTPMRRLRRLRALRAAGLTYTGISKVFLLDTGVHLDHNQLRHLLGRRERRDLSHGWEHKLMGAAR